MDTMKYQVNFIGKFFTAEDRKSFANYTMGLSTNIETMPNDNVKIFNDANGNPYLEVILTFATDEECTALCDYFISAQDKIEIGSVTKLGIQFDKGGIDTVISRITW